jgi:cysteine desulfurase
VAIAMEQQDTEAKRLRQLRDRLWTALQSLDGILLNGHPTQRLPGNLNITVLGVNGAALLLGLQPTVALSSGSACASTNAAPSHVLLALGRSEAIASASLRFGLGRHTTAAEIDRVAIAVQNTITALRSSPSSAKQPETFNNGL